MTPFDIAYGLRSTKEYSFDIKFPGNKYPAFMVNRVLSYHRDALPFAQEMNMSHGLDNLLQYDYLFHSVRQNRSGNRLKWGKRDKTSDADIQVVMEYHGYSRVRATEVIGLLNSRQLAYMKSMVRVET